MRWRLVAIASFVSGLFGFILWEIVIAVWIARMSRPVVTGNSLLLLTGFVPLLAAAIAGFFVYRHTSRRRKLQALLSIVMTLVITAGSYLLGSRLLPHQLSVVRECKAPCV
ncbi:MAG TPA: hypothetical protein VGP81_00420 [Pyrinomonadaceae bacterium]|jgi:xanthine/uracil permease|nr:hypothetical protein [Pyrinomonadaceae bacterium]